VRYAIDQKASRFTARAFAGGMLSALGHSPTFAVREFRGEAEFDDQGGGALDLTIRSDSLELVDDVPQRDRWDIIRVMNEELLETARFPEITYRCPAQNVSTKAHGGGRYDVTLNGTLTLHGVSRTQPVLAHLMAADGSIRAYGQIVIKQPAYGMKQVTAAGSMLSVKDDVKLAFDIVARKV
jgi:polyisoprenoid-binding protein YceI